MLSPMQGKNANRPSRQACVLGPSPDEFGFIILAAASPAYR